MSLSTTLSSLRSTYPVRRLWVVSSTEAKASRTGGTARIQSLKTTASSGTARPFWSSPTTSSTARASPTSLSLSRAMSLRSRRVAQAPISPSSSSARARRSPGRTRSSQSSRSPSLSRYARATSSSPSSRRSGSFRRALESRTPD